MVILRPLIQWLRLASSTLRNSTRLSSSTGLDRFTTIASGSTATA